MTWVGLAAVTVATYLTSVAETRLTLLRHGQTVWNLQGRVQGSKDSPLTPRGEAQAEATAARMTNLGVTAVYSSDLGRARQTAQVIAAACALEIIEDPRLRERNFGILEGLTGVEMETRHPTEFQLIRHGGADYTLPEGESKAGVLARVEPFFGQVLAEHPGEHVVVVSHGATMNVILRWVLGLPVDTRLSCEMRNLALTIVVHADDGQGWRLRTFGDVTHLEEADLQ